MRAITLTEQGAPQQLEFTVASDPVLGAGEVLLRMSACGVCGHDLLTRSGAIPAVTLPAVLGHELCGVIEQVAAGVTGLAVGDRVTSVQRGACGRCAPCAGGRENLCERPRAYGESRPGGYAEFCAVDARDVVRVPDAVSDEAAAIAACAIGTCLRALDRLGVAAGDRVLVTGAGGGLGVHAIQLVRERGASAVAVTSTATKASALEALADHVVIAPGGNVRVALKEAGIVIDKALDLTAGVTLGETLRSLPPGGRVCVVGNVNTDPVMLYPGLVIARELEIVGSAGATRDDLSKALSLLADGTVKAIIGSVLPLRDASEAHRLLESRSTMGRVVLRNGGS